MNESKIHDKERKNKKFAVRDTRMMMSEPSLYILDMYCGPIYRGGRKEKILRKRFCKVA